MLERIKNWWKADKGIFIGGLMLLITTSILLFNTIYACNNLQVVSGTITNISIKRQNFTYLDIKLKSDNRRFYQVYHKKLNESALPEFKVNDHITFYTLEKPIKKIPPLSDLGKKPSFYYYPPFYINKEKGIFQILYFYSYNGVFGLVFIFSFLLVVYNGFPKVLSKKRTPKIPFLIL